MTSPSQSIGATLLATLAVLGIVEHWFLVLPISINSLWGWGLASHKQTEIQEREQRAARASGGA